ncbi:HAD family hydrolase [Streptomyces sp. NPDC013161]|uniref:HAD family hydrolase n=1 Tax=Streptomyces sp. NPDC013161 TaxID=3364862 RepID=UPI0036AA9C36
MTPDAAQTEQVTEEAGSVWELITGARLVLFDFDGPICQLFAGHSADDVAKDLVTWLESHGLRALLTDRERGHPDPHAVLKAVNQRHPRSDLVAELEERLTQQELKAVDTAFPTPWADPLIRTWRAIGIHLAVATNNSPRVVTEYLRGRDLFECFAPHVYGRTSDLDLLKPNPHSLNQALRVMGSAPTDALMIGDTPSDFEAACQAGVSFLGYARNEMKETLLREAGAEAVVNSLEPILRQLQGKT